jgi:hypothetical protein
MGIIALATLTGCSKTELAAISDPTCLIVSKCTAVEATSFTAPAYRDDRTFSSVIVYYFSNDIKERKQSEESAYKELHKKGIYATKALDIIPPTLQTNISNIKKRLVDTNQEALLLITPSSRSVNSEYVPRMNVPYSDQISDDVFGGYTAETPQSGYTAYLIDLKNGAIAWKATISAEGSKNNNFSELSRKTARIVTQKIIKDGLLK